MPWEVGFKVVDCATNVPLVAGIANGTQAISNTDFTGYGSAKIPDEFDTYTVSIIRVSSYPKSVTLIRSKDEGSIQVVCLDSAKTEEPPDSGGSGGSGGGGGDGSGRPTLRCFIVSATTGSSDSAENMRLNMLRDRVLQTTELGSALLDAIYRDYYSFSPRIARELAEDDDLRGEILRIAVRPLLAWYRLAETLALDPDAPRSAEQAARVVLEACQVNAATMRTAATLLETVGQGDLLPAGAPTPLTYLASRLDDAMALPFASWAIVAPLVRIWTCAVSGADPMEEAIAWLADAPLDLLAPPAGYTRLHAELGLLARGPLASPVARHKIGARLALAWPHLVRELRQHDFICD
jgi:hypothetical protein